MAPSSSTGGLTTPKMSPPLQLRAQKLHAVLLKIVQHCNNKVMDELQAEITAISTGGLTTPKMLPPLQLRAQKLHAVLLKIVQHCNDKVMDELQAEITAFLQAQKGGSQILVHDCEVVVEQSKALLKKLRGRNPDLRDYWDPDSEIRVPKPEEIRREKIRHQRRNRPLLVRLRNVQVRASRELQPDRV